MRAVHIRVRHNDNLIIAQLADIKIIAVAFRKSAPEGVDHSLDFCVGQNLVNACLLHIQDFSPNRKNRLIHPVSGGLRRTARRIALHDKDLAFGSVPALAIRKLAVAVKGILLLGQKIGFGPFLRLADLRRLLRTGEHLL